MITDRFGNTRQRLRAGDHPPAIWLGHRLFREHRPIVSSGQPPASVAFACGEGHLLLPEPFAGAILAVTGNPTNAGFDRSGATGQAGNHAQRWVRTSTGNIQAEAIWLQFSRSADTVASTPFVSIR